MRKVSRRADARFSYQRCASVSTAEPVASYRRREFASYFVTNRASLQMLRGVRSGARNRGPFWGCDRVGACKPAFVPVRRQPATGCGCDPLAAGPPVCGSRRIAPRFANVDRSLQRPVPHWRFAYRVRGASARAGRTARRKRAPCMRI
jgi:hypothetical protein